MDNKHKKSFLSITVTAGGLVTAAIIQIFAATAAFLWSKTLKRIWPDNK